MSIGCVASCACHGLLMLCICIPGAVACFKTAGKTSISYAVHSYASEDDN